jgi:hypothetical protein
VCFRNVAPERLSPLWVWQLEAIEAARPRTDAALKAAVQTALAQAAAAPRAKAHGPGTLAPAPVFCGCLADRVRVAAAAGAFHVADALAALPPAVGLQLRLARGVSLRQYLRTDLRDAVAPIEDEHVWWRLRTGA